VQLLDPLLWSSPASTDPSPYENPIGALVIHLSAVRKTNPQREQQGRFGGCTEGVRKTRPVMLLETGRQPVRPATPTISNERPVVLAYRAA
jgi:hypothetical protein